MSKKYRHNARSAPKPMYSMSPSPDHEYRGKDRWGHRLLATAPLSCGDSPDQASHQQIREDQPDNQKQFQHQRNQVQAAFRDGGRRGRRGQELNQRSGRGRILVRAPTPAENTVIL